MSLDALLTFAMIAAVVGAWWFGWLPQHYTARPLWWAFSATAASALFLVSGLIGYDLSRHSRFIHHTAWPPTMILWEVAVGLALGALAVYCWRSALQGGHTLDARDVVR
jgi:hypothetical protein